MDPSFFFCSTKMDDEREVSEKRKLFIGAMSYSTTDESLCKAFEKFGKIVSGMRKRQRVKRIG